jgi:hypothetical protein
MLDYSLSDPDLLVGLDKHKSRASQKERRTENIVLAPRVGCATRVIAIEMRRVTEGTGGLKGTQGGEVVRR